MRGLSYNGAGCNYRNKYEIASYGSESSDSVRVQVRHYKDSYIAAEEATKGCSSENINEKNCISNSKSSENVSMSVKASSYATSDQVRVTSNQRTAVILVTYRHCKYHYRKNMGLYPVLLSLLKMN